LKENTPIRQAMFLAPVDISDIMSETDCLTRSVEDIPRDQYIIVGKIHSYFTDKRGTRTLFDDSCVRTLSKRPFGVWEHMFVTQPPIKTFKGSVRLASADRSKPYHAQTLNFVFTCETGVKMGELHDFCRSKFLSSDKALSTSVAPESFIEDDDPYFPLGGRWEVRNGKVFRKTQLRLIEFPTDDSDSGDYDDEAYERYEQVMNYSYGEDSDE
jgi:hypothetical protein